MSTAALTYARRRASMPLAGSHRPLHTVTFRPTQPAVAPERPCPLVEMISVSRITVISSDGHVAARMSDYRPYLEAPFRHDFDDFLVEYEKHGVASTDPTNIGDRLDLEVARAWQEKVADPGRLDASWSAHRRGSELGREGITGEVLFQDFGTRCVMSSPTRAA